MLRSTTAAAEGRGLTRRHLLASGGVAGLAAFAGVGPFKTATARADDVPLYLIRSTYLELGDPAFKTTDGVTLVLETIRDLPIAATEDKSQQGSEDAFVLGFSTKEPLQDGVYTLTHPLLGKFDFHVVPDSDGTHANVTVNRSVNAPKHYPKPPPDGTSEPKPPHNDEPTDDPMGTDPPEPDHDHDHRHGRKRKKRRKHVERAQLRRVGKQVVADLTLDPDAHVKSATVWLMRRERVVGACDLEHVRGARAHARFTPAKRLAGGRYVLVVVTKDRRRRSQARRFVLTLQ